MTEVVIYQPTDPRLGRHVVHDERSRAFALPTAPAPLLPVAWPRLGPILDQGSIGSCVGNTAVGLLMTAPFARPGRSYTEQDALDVYHECTVLDDALGIPGVYPPVDSGSCGLAAMKALQARGLISSYLHAFTLDAALAALQNGPLAVGTIWLTSMMTPSRGGLLKVDRASPPAGGHEFVVDAWDPRRGRAGRVRMTNSWSSDWGKAGSAWINRADFAWLLEQQGDVVQPVI